MGRTDSSAKRKLCELAAGHVSLFGPGFNHGRTPQLLARDVWQEQEHPEIGRHRYRMVSYQLGSTPGRVRRAAPCLGQDNDEVFSRWLGLEQPLALP